MVLTTTISNRTKYQQQLQYQIIQSTSLHSTRYTHNNDILTIVKLFLDNLPTVKSWFNVGIHF